MSPQGRRLGILISGRGSNFLAIADAIADHRLDAEIAVVISNHSDAPGIAAARERGLPAVVFPSKGLDREVYDRQLIDELRKNRADMVCLAGYMRILSGHFIREYPQKIVNIHPSLLPAFPGLDTHQRALDAGCKVAGATVHQVTNDLDQGPILEQAVVPVLPGDTAKTLAARVLTQEHLIYPRAIAALLPTLRA
jgi:phosphoribosylglycinamide formyltransferase 1